MVEFDILLKAPGSGKTPRVDNIDQFKPPAEDIAKCRRWLASQGVTCHSTDFGLACSATVEIFEALFFYQARTHQPCAGRALLGLYFAASGPSRD